MLTREQWAEIPTYQRYSEMSPPKQLVKEMKKICPRLDLKFYLPTEKWHVIRYLEGTRDAFTLVWQCDDRPDLGIYRHLGYWIIDALKTGDMENYARNRVEEVDEHNKKVDESNDRKMGGDSAAIASELRKPFQRLYDHGPESEYKEVF